MHFRSATIPRSSFSSHMRLISRNADGTVCRKHTGIIYVERSTCTCTALYILSVPYRFFYPYVIRVQKINDFGFICKFELLSISTIHLYFFPLSILLLELLELVVQCKLTFVKPPLFLMLCLQKCPFFPISWNWRCFYLTQIFAK